jgi:hypothetical protein
LRRIEKTPLPLIVGINSNFNPATQAGQSLILGQNVDTYNQFRTIGKIPGTTALVSGSALAFPVVSLINFEFTDYDGIRKRQQLSIDEIGGIYKINSDNTRTTLISPGNFVGSWTPHTTMNQKLFLSSPGMRNVEETPTGGFKYDGTSLRRWGVVAPGRYPDVRNALSDHTDWTGSADVSLSTDTTVTIDTDGSVRVDKTGATATVASISRSSAAQFTWADTTANPNGEFFVWLYLPPGAFQALSNSPTCVDVRIGDGATNYSMWTWGLGELTIGWNLLTGVIGAEDLVSGTGATTANDHTVRLAFHLLSNATTLSGVRWDHLHWCDRGAPTVAVGGAGAVDATVSYRVTFVTESGLESNGGRLSDSVTPASEEVDLTDIPVAEDVQVIARRIYRDKDGDSIFRFVAQIDDNATTTYTDNVADASLGGATMPIAGDDELDNSPPRRLRDVIAHSNRVFGIDAGNPAVLLISDVRQPEAFRIVDELSFDEELVALESHALGLLMYGKDRTFILLGDGVTSAFSVEELNPEFGCVGPRLAVRAKGVNVAMHEGRLSVITNPVDPWFLSGPRHDAFRDTDVTGWFLVHDRTRFRLLLVDPENYTLHVYQYGTIGYQEITGDGAGTDPLDLRVGAWWTMVLPSTNGAIGDVCVVERDDDQPEVWITQDDMIYRLNDPSTRD